MTQASFVLEDIGSENRTYEFSQDIDFAPYNGMKIDLGNAPPCYVHSAVYRLDERSWNVRLKPRHNEQKPEPGELERLGWKTY